MTQVADGRWQATSSRSQVASGRCQILSFKVQAAFKLYNLRPAHYIVLLVTLAILIPLLWFFFAVRDDGTLAEIQQRGTLRVGLDASFPPFEAMAENGQVVGLDVDLARTMAADLGVELDLVNIGFDGLYDALLARRVDLVISGLPYDPRWTEDVAYTRHYFNAGQVLVSRAGDQAIHDAEDLAGRTVAIEWGSQADMAGRRLAEELEGVTLLRQPTAAAALAAMVDGRADAAIVDGVTAAGAVSADVRPVTYLTDEWYTAAVHIESRELLAAVNETLARLEESGEMADMQVRWLHGQ